MITKSSFPKIFAEGGKCFSRKQAYSLGGATPSLALSSNSATKLNTYNKKGRKNYERINGNKNNHHHRGNVSLLEH